MISVMPWMIHGLDGGSVLGKDGNMAYFIYLILQLLLLMILKATPLLLKENKARMELHRPFSLQCIRLYNMLVFTKTSAHDWRSQQTVVCTKISEKLSQLSGSAEAFTQLRK